MDRLCVTLIVILCVVSFSQDGISGSEVELRVTPGDNVTLYCDFNLSSGVYITWFKNCSHEHQPTLVIPTHKPNRETERYDLIPFPRFMFQWNLSNKTYDLLIENITESDLGLYYCGTVENKVVDEGEKGVIKNMEIYRYGNIKTIISFDPDISATIPPSSPPPGPDCGLCWMLLFSLCPVSALLSSLLSSICVYSFCRKTAATETQIPLNRTTTSGCDIRDKEEGELCYASLDVRQEQRRPKKKKRDQNSDFSTYTAINTSRV